MGNRELRQDMMTVRATFVLGFAFWACAAALVPLI